MPHRHQTHIYHTTTDTISVVDLINFAKSVLAAYHITLQDFSKITPVAPMGPLFVDVYVNQVGLYLVTNCVIVDDRFDEEIKNENHPYQLKISLGVEDVSDEISKYKTSDVRIKESALLVMILNHRNKFDTPRAFFEFLSGDNGRVQYNKAYELFRRAYKNDG